MILYGGASMIDGAPIVCVATFGSRNPKTGDMVQTWIMRSDISPTEAAHAGRDASVCGSCALRGAVVDGRNKGRVVRAGSYGDPAAVPFEVWDRLKIGTAYTHQWRTCDRRLQAIAMASVDNVAEYHEAIAAGWRTFRVRRPGALEPGEIVCPASAEGGKRTNCLFLSFMSRW